MRNILVSNPYEIRNYLYILILILFTSCTDNSPMKKQVLIVTGGHNFERESFFQIFDDLPEIEYFEVEHPEANDIYTSEKIDRYDVIVFYDMARY